jgi:hypothetical protein
VKRWTRKLPPLLVVGQQGREARVVRDWTGTNLAETVEDWLPTRPGGTGIQVIVVARVLGWEWLHVSVTLRAPTL